MQRQSRDVISPSRFLQARFNPLEFANSSKHLERLYCSRWKGLMLLNWTTIFEYIRSLSIRVIGTDFSTNLSLNITQHAGTSFTTLFRSMYKLEPTSCTPILSIFHFKIKKKTAHLLESKESTTLSSMTHKFPKTSIDRILLPHSTIREQSNRFPTCTQPERRSRSRWGKERDYIILVHYKLHRLTG